MSWWKMVILGRENGSWKVSPSQDEFRLIAQLKGDYGRKMGRTDRDGLAKDGEKDKERQRERNKKRLLLLLTR